MEKEVPATELIVFRIESSPRFLWWVVPDNMLAFAHCILTTVMSGSGCLPKHFRTSWPNDAAARERSHTLVKTHREKCKFRPRWYIGESLPWIDPDATQVITCTVLDFTKV